MHEVCGTEWSDLIGQHVSAKDIRGQTEGESRINTCEAKIKAMDKSCKILDFIQHLFRKLGVPNRQCPDPLLYNDNEGGMCWSLSEVITKKLRHLNICEVAIRDAVRNKDIVMGHAPRLLNLVDIFTKEMKDAHNFLQLQAAIMSPRVPLDNTTAKSLTTQQTIHRQHGRPLLLQLTQ